MKTKVLIEIGNGYDCYLALSPDQAAVFIKLIQGATIVQREGYGDDTKYVKTDRAIAMVNVDENRIVEPAAPKEDGE
jgi:hypothetical protein